MRFSEDEAQSLSARTWRVLATAGLGDLCVTHGMDRGVLLARLRRESLFGMKCWRELPLRLEHSSAQAQRV